MKKLIAASTISALLSTSALAADLSARLSGRLQFEAVSVSQSGLKGDEKNVSANRRNIGAGSNAYVGARVVAEHEGLKYGAHLSLITSTIKTSSPAYERSHIFMESNYGKVELGSNFDAATAMEMNALTYARASGDNATDYIMKDIKDAGGTRRDGIKLFQYTYNEIDGSGEGARKVTYYTPEFNGFQLGVSYVPDSTNFGSSTVKDTKASEGMKSEYLNTPKGLFRDKLAMKDVWAGGVTYNHHVNENTSFKLALTGEHGKAAVKGKKIGTNAEYAMPNLKTYNIGAAFTTGPYTLVASYADFGKQGSKEVFGKDQNKNKYYTVGAVYKDGPIGASISYYNSKHHGNKFDTWVLATDYALAPGLMPYAEITYFNGKAKLPEIYAKPEKKKFKGTVFALGAKLMF